MGQHSFVINFPHIYEATIFNTICWYIHFLWSSFRPYCCAYMNCIDLFVISFHFISVIFILYILCWWVVIKRNRNSVLMTSRISNFFLISFLCSLLNAFLNDYSFCPVWFLCVVLIYWNGENIRLRKLDIKQQKIVKEYFIQHQKMRIPFDRRRQNQILKFCWPEKDLPNRSLPDWLNFTFPYYHQVKL